MGEDLGRGPSDLGGRPQQEKVGRGNGKEVAEVGHSESKACPPSLLPK